MSVTTGTITEKVTRFDVETVEKALRKIGIPKNKISTMVLGRDASYLSNALCNEKCNKEDLKKLCEFLSLNYDSVIIVEAPEVVEEKKPEPTKTPKDVVNLDALIIGINQLYQIEKSNNVLLKDMLEQIKISNTKVGRLENVIGQIHTNIIVAKKDVDEIKSLVRETKSSTAIISGRVKDMLAKFK